MPAQALPFPYRNDLDLPVIGLESEFKTFVDGEEVVPDEYWRTPSGFIERPLLRRTSKASQLPTGGAVYFDGGVLEVVTPVIELAPQCTARVVRSLWEQIGFIREELDGWESRTGHSVRLQAFSCHCNISFELPRDERNEKRTIQKLAYLLAHLLTVPIIVSGLNRRSTGIGVRPRRERLEITLDFIPDPGLMAATMAFIVGVVREVISWPSYRLEDLESLPIPIIAGVNPGKHATRKGWLTRDYHFPRSPFTSDIDAPIWPTRDHRLLSLREIALGVATHFADSIRAYADPFSVRLLFSILGGETPSLLDLPDRPAAYDDIGRTTRWGTSLPELENFAPLMDDAGTLSEGLRSHIATRETRRRERQEAIEQARGTSEPLPRRRSADVEEKLMPPWAGEENDRRHASPARGAIERRSRHERRATLDHTVPPLTRSAYENVFLNLASGKQLRVDGELWTPIVVKGWYHAGFSTPSGQERLLSIDQLLALQDAWE